MTATTNDPQLLWDLEEGVGVITLNRATNMNALDDHTLTLLADAVVEAANSEDVRALVLTGSGRGFCTGGDLDDWSDPEYQSPTEPWVPKLHRVMSTLYWMPKPVFAAVNGYALGAGCDLSLVADQRIASTQARFGEVYVGVGYSPDAGGSFLLPRIVGESRAADLIYSGRIIDADEALSIGLVSAVVAPDELMPCVMQQARTLAEGPTKAIGLAKQNIRQSYTVSFDEALRLELRAGEICARTEDHVEGLRAITDKRAARFVGR